MIQMHHQTIANCNSKSTLEIVEISDTDDVDSHESSSVFCHAPLASLHHQVLAQDKRWASIILANAAFEKRAAIRKSQAGSLRLARVSLFKNFLNALE